MQTITYADHTASGRPLHYIEDYIINKNVLPFYGKLILIYYYYYYPFVISSFILLLLLLFFVCDYDLS